MGDKAPTIELPATEARALFNWLTAVDLHSTPAEMDHIKKEAFKWRVRLINLLDAEEDERLSPLTPVQE